MFADIAYEAVYGVTRGGKPVPTTIMVDPLSLPQVPIQCKICHKYMETERSLKRHYTMKHKKNLNKFHCPQCPRSYVHKQHMNYHLKHECGVPPKFKCAHCDDRFKHKHLLIMHMRTTHPEIAL